MLARSISDLKVTSRKEQPPRRTLTVESELAGYDIPRHFGAKPGTLIAPQSLELRGDALTFAAFGDGTGTPPPRAIPDDLLMRFMDLAEGSDKDVLQFAKRYAVLGICPDHALPVWHTDAVLTIEDFLVGYNAPKLLLRTNCRVQVASSPRQPPTRFERVSDWRLRAQRFKLVFECASKLKRGEKPTPLNRPFLLGWASEPVTPDLRHAKHTGLIPIGHKVTPWQDLSRIVDSWLFDARVTPRLVERTNHPEIVLSGHPKYAFGALALQMLLFIRSTRVPEVCDHCGKDMPFRKRAAKTGQGRACHLAECRRRVKLAWLKQHRAKKRELISMNRTSVQREATKATIRVRARR